MSFSAGISAEKNRVIFAGTFYLNQIVIVSNWNKSAFRNLRQSLSSRKQIDEYRNGQIAIQFLGFFI